ncbi:MAG: hypothetical protein MJY83_03555 [Bacteroidales bacterium]|nr:hypothetical protein [Bacteroidales bacterium]
MVKKLFVFAVAIVVLSVSTSNAQNPLRKVEYGDEDLNAMMNFMDSYNFDSLAEIPEDERGGVAMNYFITQYLIAGKQADKSAFVPSFSIYPYYYVNYLTYYARSKYESAMKDDEGNWHLAEAEYYGHMGKSTHEPISLREYEQMGIRREDIRGNGYLPPISITSSNYRYSKSDYKDGLLEEKQHLNSMMIACEIKPIDPSFEIEPLIDENTVIEIGKPIEFQIHAKWRGCDVDSIAVAALTHGKCHIDGSHKVETDDKGIGKVKVVIDDYGLCQLYVEYSTTDTFWGPMECVCEYYFSLEKDEYWEYRIDAKDRMSYPGYDYNVVGTMEFEVFKYGRNRNLVYEDIAGEHNILLGHDVTKKTEIEEEQTHVQPLVTYHKALMESPKGVLGHEAATSKIIYEEGTENEHNEAVLAFDQDKLKSFEKKGKKDSRRMLMESLAFGMGLSGELQMESTEAPPMLMRFPLREGAMPFQFSIRDIQSMLFGLDEKTVSAMMSGEPMDPQAALEALGSNDGCVVIPNVLRLMQMGQLGSIFMSMGEDGPKDDAGSISGTITLKKLDPDIFKESLELIDFDLPPGV